MPVPKVLCLVLAGGRGSRLGPLTTGRAKPSLPVGGHYRLIDLSLSNAAHSRLTDVWVLQQYEPHLLNEHLSGGRPWDLDRSRGGFRTLPPFEGPDHDGFATGNADALVRHWPVISAFEPDVLLVCSADHLVKIDLQDVIAAHLGSGADATLVSILMPAGADVSRYLVVRATGGSVSGLDYKPENPQGRRVGTEVFAYRPNKLRDALVELRKQNDDLGDYGERLLPHLVAEGSVANVDHRGHWRDLGTPEAYLDGQLELLKDNPPLVLDDPDWPILTSMPVRAAARIQRTAELDRVWISPGADVAGTVVNSVIGPGVRIEQGAVVRHSVVMSDAVVRSGAQVSRTVIAERTSIGHEAQIGAPNAVHPVLIGAHRRVPDRANISAGAHLQPTRPRDLFRTTR